MKAFLIFTKTHHVLKSEKILRENSIVFDVVPNPRKHVYDCGISLLIDCDNIDEASSLIKNNNIEVCVQKE